MRIVFPQSLPTLEANNWYWQILDAVYPAWNERLFRRIFHGKNWENNWLKEVQDWLKL